jgi:hypothetical protein
LADGLDRAHLQRIKSVGCDVQGRKVLLTLYADQMPDVDLWGAQQKGKLFEKVFKVKLGFAWRAVEAAAR